MSTDKKSIYSDSYTMKPVDKKEILEELRGRTAEAKRAKKLGILLKEEKTRSQELQQRVNRLNEENRRLRESLAVKSRDAHPNPRHSQ